MGSGSLLLLVALGLLIWFWQDTLRAREQAIRAARNVCKNQELQLLDATVIIQRIAVRRSTGGGKLTLERTFQFMYSPDGVERQTGFIITRAQHIYQVGL